MDASTCFIQWEPPCIKLLGVAEAGGSGHILTAVMVPHVPNTITISPTYGLISRGSFTFLPRRPHPLKVGSGEASGCHRSHNFSSIRDFNWRNSHPPNGWMAARPTLFCPPNFAPISSELTT